MFHFETAMERYNKEIEAELSTLYHGLYYPEHTYEEVRNRFKEELAKTPLDWNGLMREIRAGRVILFPSEWKIEDLE